MQREEAYKIAQQCAQFLKEQFNVQNVYIFGSVVGDGIWHRQSDIDIAVEGLPSDKYFKALADLDAILPRGLDIDLITLENAPARLKERIMPMNDRDRRKNEDKIERLTLLIKSELETLDEIHKQIKETLDYISEHGISMIIKRGMGSCLQDFYSCIEMMFERITVTFDGNIPEGKEWHRLLLEQMAVNTQNRPAVISHDLSLILSEYLKFRHRFRHIYGGELDWDKLYPLAIGISKVLNNLKNQINDFLNQIQE